MTEAFTRAMNAPERQIAIRGGVTFGFDHEAAFDGGDVVSIRISEGSDSGILPGAVLSANCTIVLDNSMGQWDEGGGKRGVWSIVGGTFCPEIGVYTENGWEYAPLGVFRCTDETRDENSSLVTLTCSDRLRACGNLPFEDRLSYPATIYREWMQAVTQAGFEYHGIVPSGERIVDYAPDWGEISVSAAMGYIAAVAGCFVRVNRQGEIELVPLVGGAEYDITPDVYFSRKLHERTLGPVNVVEATTVNRMGDKNSELVELIAAPDAMIQRCVFTVTGNPLFITGAAHAHELVWAMRDNLAGLVYRECAFSWRGDPALMPGSMLRVSGVDGSETVCMLSRQTMTFDSGFTADCTCGVPDGAANSVSLYRAGQIDTGRLVGVIDGDSIAVNAITAAKIEAGAITTEKLAAGSVTADKIAAGSIDADKISSGTITADKLVSGIITAGSGLIGTGAIGTAQIADGSITAAKIVSLNADVISAGTISADRLLLMGEGGVIYEINALASGLSRSELNDSQYANKIAGTVIAARSITAEQLAAQSITANEIAANAITADKVNIASLFSAQAVIDAINTMDISSNTYLRLLVGGEMGGRNYIRNSDSVCGENYAIIGASGGVYMDGAALVIIFGVDASQSGTVLSIS